LLKAKGMEINEVDQEAFIKALRPVWDQFVKTDRQKKIVDFWPIPSKLLRIVLAVFGHRGV